MKNIKRFIAVIAAVGVIATAGVTFAASTNTPAELEASKTQMLEQKKEVLDQRVADGSLTQEKANEIYNAIKENQATCDGTGSAMLGQKYGVGFGSSAGKGMNQGQAKGQGQGMSQGQARGQTQGKGMSQRMGNAAGLRDGSCVVAE